ncbi:basal body-orientation factor 1-like [Diorhabda carinulata]|uniref:basal body-orientation factor 1-like n=1 Tax=Diorhabda carinulata TaxID=1163345 RepID=UPI0025A16FF5|nr:basal body-orientation factor 1-like [Diorhabda carinulata]
MAPQISQFISTIPNKDATNHLDTIQKNKSLPADIMNLVKSLRASREENNDLQMRNDELKEVIRKLESENETLKQSLVANQEKFDQAIDKLEHQIKYNKESLLENNKECLTRQKKSLIEISELKTENEQLKKEIESKERNYKEQIRKLETEFEKAIEENVKVGNQNQEVIERAMKYKGKLKHALAIIKDLNTLLIERSAKSELCHACTQIGYGESSIPKLLETKELNPPEYNESRQEERLLSDIFFKKTSFCENEILLFKGNIN